MRNHRYLAVMVLVVVFLISGCSWYRSHGKVRPLSRHEEKLTLQGLIENWQDYAIYYAGSSAQQPSAIMFDPKMDTNTLTSDKWIKVENQETLLELISWLQHTTRFPPRLQRILGPDDQFFGYFYSGWNHVVLKVVDERTLWASDLPVAPDFYYNGNGEEKNGDPDPRASP